MTFQKELSCGMLYVNILRVGEDCQILLSGGSRPHIGCTVLGGFPGLLCPGTDTPVPLLPC